MTGKTLRWLLLLGLGAALYWYGSRWLAIDRCLDAGGAYDYEHRRCVYPAEPPD
jgi:hypothetical protein